MSTDLYLEAKRDLGALGCNARVINGLQAIDNATKNKNWTVQSIPRNLKDGCMFMTYSALVSRMKTLKKRISKGMQSTYRSVDLILFCMCCVFFFQVSGFNGKRKTARHISRLEQLINWCGGESFDGVLVFDESHRAKNYN